MTPNSQNKQHSSAEHLLSSTTKCPHRSHPCPAFTGVTEQPVVTALYRLIPAGLAGDHFPNQTQVLEVGIFTVVSPNVPEDFVHPSDFNEVSLDFKPRNYATVTGRGGGNHLGSQKFESEIWKES